MSTSQVYREVYRVIVAGNTEVKGIERNICLETRVQAAQVMNCGSIPGKIKIFSLFLIMFGQAIT